MVTKQSTWSRNYNERAYDRISVMIPRGRLATLQACCKDRGDSVNGVINRCLREYLNMSEEEWKAKPDTIPEGISDTQKQPQ